ncbi:MAG TPA: PilZ domain-containing protein [Sphingomonas sp.]|nr:PilZ domain-containing protein [Sphingomonas sp.]
MTTTPPGAATDRRGGAARRHKTFWPTILRTATGNRRAHILNISRTGAKLHAQLPAKTGETVEILVEESWRGGLVRWSNGSAFGIAFNEPVPEDVLDQCLRATAPAVAADTCLPTR